MVEFKFKRYDFHVTNFDQFKIFNFQFIFENQY